MRIINLNIDHGNAWDERRIPVIANSLPPSGGVQIAGDTTLVSLLARPGQLAGDTTLGSLLTRAGQPRMRGRQYRGTASSDAKGNKERTRPELFQDRRCRHVVLGSEMGGRWRDEAATFLSGFWPKKENPPGPSHPAPLPP